MIFKGNIMNIDDVTFFFIRSLLIQYDYYDYVIDETSNGKESNYENSLELSDSHLSDFYFLIRRISI